VLDLAEVASDTSPVDDGSRPFDDGQSLGGASQLGVRGGDDDEPRFGGGGVPEEAEAVLQAGRGAGRALSRLPYCRGNGLAAVAERLGA
jgi:hypothetical protein